MNVEVEHASALVGAYLYCFSFTHKLISSYLFLDMQYRTCRYILNFPRKTWVSNRYQTKSFGAINSGSDFIKHGILPPNFSVISLSLSLSCEIIRVCGRAVNYLLFYYLLTYLLLYLRVTGCTENITLIQV